MLPHDMVPHEIISDGMVPRHAAELHCSSALSQQTVPAAAGALGVSSSQLVRLLGKEPAALGALNRLRGAAGLKPLR